ncbi:MAG: hypothetical protein MUP58_00955 [Candidatus Nanohaloarchaeota archaeon QJJ-9]|nr:hypothetical protein [Candidatus Nanohaloarchaeota archaeon QJJ-9]
MQYSEEEAEHVAAMKDFFYILDRDFKEVYDEINDLKEYTRDLQNVTGILNSEEVRKEAERDPEEVLVDQLEESDISEMYGDLLVFLDGYKSAVESYERLLDEGWSREDVLESI